MADKTEKEIAEADWRSLGVDDSQIDEAGRKVQNVINDIGTTEF